MLFQPAENLLKLSFSIIVLSDCFIKMEITINAFRTQKVIVFFIPLILT